MNPSIYLILLNLIHDPGDPLAACEEIEKVMRKRERARWKA